MQGLRFNFIRRDSGLLPSSADRVFDFDQVSDVLGEVVAVVVDFYCFDYLFLCELYDFNEFVYFNFYLSGRVNCGVNL